jgi:hypothetical protein
MKARSASYLDLHVEIKNTTDTSRSASYLDLHVEIKDTTDTSRYASYLDLHVEIDSEGWLRTTDFHSPDFAKVCRSETSGEISPVKKFIKRTIKLTKGNSMPQVSVSMIAQSYERHTKQHNYKEYLRYI